MKTNLLFIALLFFAINIAAQQNPDCSTLKTTEVNIIDILKEKSETINKAQLEESIIDSIVYYSFLSIFDSIREEKIEFTWDEFGNRKTKLEYLWDQENSQWITNIKSDYIWNENNKLTEENRLQWDSMQNQWVNYRKILLTWDEYGYDESYKYLKWNDELNRWDNYYRDESNYDENGNLLSWIYYLGNMENEWEPSSKTESNYNIDNNRISDLNSLWDTENEIWITDTKVDYTYTNLGLLDISHDSIWHENTWDPYRMSEHFYNSNQMEESVISYVYWEYTWRESSKIEYAYDENNNKILRHSFSWDSYLNEWFNSNISYHEFNEEDKTIMASYYYWDLFLAAWVGQSKNERIYNENGEINLVIKYAWDENTADWILEEKDFYYFSSPSNIEEPSSILFAAYPNPFKSIININIQNNGDYTCSVFTTCGQPLMQFHLNNAQTKLDLSNLKTGIYILQINNGTKTATKKIIKY